MNKAQRRSEKFFRIALWAVAVVFAGFLVNLGSAVVKNLPLVEQRFSVEDFLDADASKRIEQELKRQRNLAQDALDALEQSRLKLEAARQNSQTARDSLSAWLASRQVTQQSARDDEVIQRTAALEHLKLAERDVRSAVEAEEQHLLDAQQAQQRAQRQLDELRSDAYEKMNSEQSSQELKVFLIRLAITLPLLLIAGWLFARQRKCTWWPFVWGYIYFALFVFFVELVPYLPSYGGYVRNIVGVVITVLVGRQAIVSFNRYRERQLAAESKPDIERRKEISYDTSLLRLAKKVCPGCERPVELDNPQIDFCQHCGLSLFDHCTHCQTRKSAFARFCFACGSDAAQPAEPPAT
ncbi:serine endopeptidase [Pseudomonas sp. MAP12]|uniref:Serine endopeptidase n=1 Tax=Geopseudomonas aromaticivorans TaxID=2849492 RepID=A0ABS6MYM6_9GAMM|nr:zinc ribbon domain-containing protein [Pseudomonas aromaticivorans]MBV2133908.1 serine endopeptidase [Pseudomonas aromaticivorans]